MYSIIAFATQWGSKYGGINNLLEHGNDTTFLRA